MSLKQYIKSEVLDSIVLEDIQETYREICDNEYFFPDDREEREKTIEAFATILKNWYMTPKDFKEFDATVTKNVTEKVDERIVYNAIRTPDGTVLESKSRYDFVEYTDANGKTYMVDGGLDYLRRSAHPDQIDLSVRMRDGHDNVREAMTWGTRGINGDEPLRYVKLKDMDTDHIVAVLETQPNILPQFRDVMETELQIRGL